MYRNLIKNIFDYILAVSLLLLFLPLMFFIYIYLLSQICSPIFVQKRPGLNNRIFDLYKFRTILDNDSKNLYKIKKNLKFLLFLRKTGLDELPQLFNVLKGDLSLIGPRPLLVKYLKIKSFKNHPRRKCKPGITGLAQIESYDHNKTKGGFKWKRQFELDKYYYYNISLILDLKILFFTFYKFFKFRKNDYHNEPILSRKYVK